MVISLSLSLPLSLSLSLSLLFFPTFSAPVEWNQTAPATNTKKKGRREVGCGRKRKGASNQIWIHGTLVNQ